jgi:hypothetical protein
MPEPEAIEPQNDRPEEPIDHTVLNPTHEDLDREERQDAEEEGDSAPPKPFDQVVTKAGGPPPTDETDPLRTYPVETSEIYHSDADLAVQPIETAEEAPLGAAGAQRKPENEASMVPGLREAPRIARSSEEV